MGRSAPFPRLRAEIAVFVSRWRYAILLAALSAGMIAQALIGENPVGLAATNAWFLAIIVAAALAAEAPRRTVALIAALAAAQLFSGVGSDQPLALSANVAITAVLTGVTFWLTVAALFDRAAVGADALAGAAFGFLLLGLVFALLYSAAEIAAPGSFSLVEGAGSTPAQLVYFSLITLTTTGYGDVTPVSPVMRLVAALEAALGALYLAGLIGRLLGVAFDRRARF